MGWILLAICFSAACFLAWREEHLKVKSKALRAILNKIADKTKDTVTEQDSAGRTISHYDSIAALIELSDEFGCDEDVEKVCSWLKKSNTHDPFEVYESSLGAVGAFKNKRLAFLQDARAKHGPPIKTHTDAIAFIRTFWADANHLWESAVFPAHIVNGFLVWEREMCKPISAAKAERIYLYPPAVPEGSVRPANFHSSRFSQ